MADLFSIGYQVLVLILENLSENDILNFVFTCRYFQCYIIEFYIDKRALREQYAWLQLYPGIMDRFPIISKLLLTPELFDRLQLYPGVMDRFPIISELLETPELFDWAKTHTQIFFALLRGERFVIHQQVTLEPFDAVTGLGIKEPENTRLVRKIIHEIARRVGLLSKTVKNVRERIEKIEPCDCGSDFCNHCTGFGHVPPDDDIPPMARLIKENFEGKIFLVQEAGAHYYICICPPVWNPNKNNKAIGYVTKPVKVALRETNCHSEFMSRELPFPVYELRIAIPSL